MKVLFIDSTHEILYKMLKENSIETEHLYGRSLEDYLSIIHKYDGIIIRSGIIINKAFIDKATKLKFIGRLGAGLENIDIEYAEKSGIKCFNSPEGNRDAVGEHALGMLLSLFNNLKRSDSEVRNLKWNREKNRGLEIKGKTIGIIGYGNMGGAFARRLKGFGANVIAYDKYKFNYSDEFAEEKSMEEIFENAEIVSLHIPLTEETNYLVNEAWINSFKKDFYLINTARGKVVQTKALLKAMNKGKIKGACLDVLEYEKTSFENLEEKDLSDIFKELLKREDIIFTPHIAGWTQESKIKLSQFLGEKIINFIKSN